MPIRIPKRFPWIMTLSLLLTACASTQHSDLLSIFFDGVPGATTNQSSDSTQAGADAPLPEIYLAARAAPTSIRHKPFAEHDCMLCHESDVSEKLRDTIPSLCQSCHIPVSAPRPFPHEPMAKGECLKCHTPHESKEPGLLTLPEEQVCAQCHHEKPFLDTPAHAKAGDSKCHTCHDPHGGQDRFYLRTPATDGARAPIAPGYMR